VLVLLLLCLAQLCCCPFSRGTFLEHHWSPSSILQSGRSLFLVDTFFFATLLWVSLQGHHFVGFSPSILQLVEVIFFGCISLVCPLALGIFLGLLLVSFPFVLALASWSYLLDIFLWFAHLLGHYLSGFSLEPFRVIFSALIVHPKTDLSCFFKGKA